MTANLFIILFVAFAAISICLTEAIKKFYENCGKTPSANIIALIDAIIIGGAGTSSAYLFLGIPFITTNIIAIIGMVVCVWMGSMIGYDKIKQLLLQIFEK